MHVPSQEKEVGRERKNLWKECGEGGTTGSGLGLFLETCGTGGWFLRTVAALVHAVGAILSSRYASSRLSSGSETFRRTRRRVYVGDVSDAVRFPSQLRQTGDDWVGAEISRL